MLSGALPGGKGVRKTHDVSVITVLHYVFTSGPKKLAGFKSSVHALSAQQSPHNC